MGDNLIGDLLPFIQASKPGPFERADMNELVAAGIGLNEPEPFRCIEPFHRANDHGALLSNKRTNLADPRVIARRSPGDQWLMLS
jgi:hypothetical protein